MDRRPQLFVEPFPQSSFGRDWVLWRNANTCKARDDRFARAGQGAHTIDDAYDVYRSISYSPSAPLSQTHVKPGVSEVIEEIPANSDSS